MLKELRLKHNLSQEQLSSLSGVTVRSIRAYEQGSRDIDIAAVSSVIALAEALEEPFYNLLNSPELVDRIKLNVK